MIIMRNYEPLDKALRLESERLLLKPITEEDTELVLSFRNADYVRNNFFYRVPISVEDHLKFYKNRCETGEVFYFLVYEKETETPIGCVYLQTNPHEPEALESGVFFSENAPKGRGYATEAVKMLNLFAFNNLKAKRTIARVIADNHASLNLHIRAGFKEISRSDEKIIPTGEVVEAVTFELLPEYLSEDK